MMIRTADTARVIWHRDPALLWPSMEAAEASPVLVPELAAPVEEGQMPTVYELRPLSNFEASGIMGQHSADLQTAILAIAIRALVAIDTPTGRITDRAAVVAHLESPDTTPMSAWAALRDMAWKLTRGAHADRPFRVAGVASAGADSGSAVRADL